MKETVCVTGGSGGIGQALLEQLVDLYEVKALFRSKNDTAERWEKRGCRAVWGDVTSDAALAELVRGTTFVFHCAALITGSYKDSYAVNVEGTRRLARAAAANGCQRFVHISSVAVYSAARTDSDYTENAELVEYQDMAVYALTKLQSERALVGIAREDGLDVTILRPTCVYGPNTKSYTLMPLDLIRKGLPVILGDGRGVMDVVYVGDVAKALLSAAQSPHARGEVFNIGHETVTLNDFYSHYSRMLDRPARHIPTPIVRTIAKLLDVLPGTHDVRRGARFLIRMSENTKAFPSSKAAALLGYSPEVSLSTGMLKTELWAKQKCLVAKTQFSLDNYGPLRFRPLAIVHPSSERELVEIAQLASNTNIKAKAIGSLHSLCPIPETDGVCLVLDRYKKLLKVDGSLVTVEAGMTLRELNETLAGLKLALPVSGSITAQTVSGAISTATHGGTIFHGSLSDYVESVRIVRADGSVLEIDRSHDLFNGVVVSVGVLGIISAVTLRCVPAFALQARSAVRKAEDVLDAFDDINRNSLYTDMLYFPITDEIEILSVDRLKDRDVDNLHDVSCIARRKPAPKGMSRGGQILKVLGLKLFAWLLLRGNTIQRFFTKFSVGSCYPLRIGRSDWVLAFGDLGDSDRSPDTIRDMEVALPYEQAPAAIGLLRTHFQTTRTFPLMPIHIRSSARSDLWLSPAYGRDVVWLECWQYPRSATLFDQIHQLLRPFHYRFHWGKETRAERDYIKGQYERWDDFVRLREEWDPNGVFLNDYLESFFCQSDSWGAGQTRVPVTRRITSPK
jgi:L-gulonolactone oxidase